MNDQDDKKQNDQSGIVQRQETQPISVMGGFPILNDNDIDKVIADADKFIKVQSRLRSAALRVTNSADWVSQDSKPYLEKSGSDKIAMAFGLSYKDMGDRRDRHKDDKGDYIIIESLVRITFQGREIDQTGTCSTRDSFFGTKGGEPKPLSEVDLTNIKKKSVTNAIQRAIKSILGLEFTWEEVAEATGGKVTQDTVQGINRSKGGNAGANNSNSAEATGVRTAIWNKILEMNNGHIVEAQKQLAELTAFQGRDGAVPGKTEISKISDAAMVHLTKKVNDAYEKFKKAAPAANSTTPADGAKNG